MNTNNLLKICYAIIGRQINNKLNLKKNTSNNWTTLLTGKACVFLKKTYEK